MIIDSIEKLEEYKTLNPLFPKAIEYIKSLDFNNLQTGKVEIDGKNLFVSVNETNLKTVSNARLEVHNQYLDIQIPVSKAEGFGWSPRAEMKKPVAAFDDTKDIQFFEDDYSMQFSLQPGNFVIFFPQDAHAPCVGEGAITKIIVKVKI